MTASAHGLNTPRATDWRTKAACLDRADEMFPDNDKSGIEHAKTICAPCPVRKACLKDAMQIEGSKGSANRHGIRGGLSPKQRRRLYEELRDRVQTEAA